jgi:catechol 2,3-dioxygenase-like lactoylglutathione lyase family enzyme
MAQGSLLTRIWSLPVLGINVSVNRLAEPAALVAELLHDALRRGFVHRTGVQLEHGADPNRPGDHSVFGARVPYQDAIERGYPNIASMLVAAGALPVNIGSVEQIIGRCLSGETVTPTEAAMARDQTSDLVRVAKPGHLEPKFHRKRTGLGHIAFLVESAEMVDQFVKDFLVPHGIEPLYRGAMTPTGYPPGYYAVYFEDPDRIKVEVVYEKR